MGNDTKKVVWKLTADEEKATLSVDMTKSNNADKENLFSFEIQRFKDINTKRELLEIQAKYHAKGFGIGAEGLDADDESIKGEDWGSISTSMPDLESNIKKFMSFGVVLDGSRYVDMAREIIIHYLEIPKKDSSTQPATDKFDKDCERAFKMVANYLGSGFKESNGCYHIAVDEAREILADSILKLPMNVFRQWLKEKNFTVCMESRTDNLVRIDKKPTRVLSFKSGTINEIVAKAQAEKAPV